MQLANPLDSIYITPHVFMFPSLEELHVPLQGADYYLRLEQNNRIDFNSLLHFKRLFILAETGYGKSRLVKRIQAEYPTGESRRVDCKELKNQTIAGYLADEYHEKVPLKYLLLDALDEVDNQFISDTITHQQVNQFRDRDSAWVHAYLYRKEGDSGNADYWYRRACRLRPAVSIEEEWAALVEYFLHG